MYSALNAKTDDNEKRKHFTTALCQSKFVAIVLLIGSQYAFLTWPICLNHGYPIENLYTYCAIGSTILLALSYIIFTSELIYLQFKCLIIFELILSVFLFIAMVCVTNVTLHMCIRPSALQFLLPETLGLVATGSLLLRIGHSFWNNRHELK